MTDNTIHTRDGPFTRRRRNRAGGRVNLLFVLPFFFVVSAFRSDPLGLLFNLAAFGTLLASAKLTRDGVLAEQVYDARSVAKRPTLPRKLVGTLAMGVGLGFAGLGDGTIGAAIIYAVLGAGFHWATFGADPLRDKGLGGAETADRFRAERVDQAVREAESHLASMHQALAETGDRPLQARLEGVANTARRMFRAVESDPRELPAARKYLGVFLLGARDATVKFAALHARTRDRAKRDANRARYVALLDDLERDFAVKTDTLLENDQTDLDIEIEVLRDRLSHN